MLDHADQQLARLIDVPRSAPAASTTRSCWCMSDNGASQEGGPLGFVNAMGPFNMSAEPIDGEDRPHRRHRRARHPFQLPAGLGDGLQHAAERYKQNTHGGGIRDPLVIVPGRTGIARAAASCATSSATPATSRRPCSSSSASSRPRRSTASRRCRSRARASPRPSPTPTAPSQDQPQYFEMFGHRGLWHDGCKAVAFHPPGTPFDDDVWELYHLARDFNENHDLAERRARAAEGDDRRLWWRQAEAHQVLPLDDRFGDALRRERRALPRRRARSYMFQAGMGHRADRRRARPAQPQLHDRGRCPHRRAGDRGRADRPRRRDLRLLALHQGQPARATT